MRTNVILAGAMAGLVSAWLWLHRDDYILCQTLTKLRKIREEKI